MRKSSHSQTVKLPPVQIRRHTQRAPALCLAGCGPCGSPSSRREGGRVRWEGAFAWPPLCLRMAACPPPRITGPSQTAHPTLYPSGPGVEGGCCLLHSETLSRVVPYGRTWLNSPVSVNLSHTGTLTDAYAVLSFFKMKVVFQNTID